MTRTTAAAAVSAVSAAVLLVAPPLAVSLTLAVLPGGGAHAQPPAPGCGGGGTATTAAGVALSAEQVGNAATVVAVTAGRRLPAYAAVIAVATAYQESRLVNDLAELDHDSEGLFQQRVSIYTRAVADDPVRATTAFLDRLVEVRHWQRLPLTVAAQAVQRSAYPDAYVRWRPMATGIVGRLWPTAAAATPAGPGSAPPGGVPTGGVLCPGGGGDGQGGGGTAATAVPTGLVINGSVAARTAVRYALAQLGRPYVWGAAGPAAFDCSGLTMAAWARAGVALPHYTGDQLRAGTPEPTNLSQAVAGDLVFIAGSDGTPAAPGHVGMLAGYLQEPDGRHLFVVQAPRTGTTVTLTDLTRWSGLIVAVRHIA